MEPLRTARDNCGEPSLSADREDHVAAEAQMIEFRDEVIETLAVRVCKGSAVSAGCKGSCICKGSDQVL